MGIEGIGMGFISGSTVLMTRIIAPYQFSLFIPRTKRSKKRAFTVLLHKGNFGEQPWRKQNRSERHLAKRHEAM
jgi:hypothetical protein